MPDEVTKLRIFVASPGDVLDERQRLKLVVDELNRTLADSLGQSLELLDWRDVIPSMGRPQQVILNQLKLDAWDIFVGILWTRFGTPTGATHPETGEPFLSGTEEEFTLAYHSWQRTSRPQILFYRCMRPPQLDKLDASQFQRVQQFFARFKVEGEHRGLYQSYKTPEEFERRVRGDLMRLILNYSTQLPVAHQTTLKNKIAELEKEEPLHVPFVNREDEIDLLLSSLAPAYYLLDAPAGYGKTELMQQLKERFAEKNWICAYNCVKESDVLLDVAQSLAKELEFKFSPMSEQDPRQLGEDWAGALKAQKEKAIAQPESGLVLLIDLDKKPPIRLVKTLVQEFIPGIQESLRGLRVFAAKHNRFRVVLAGRYLAGREEVRSPLTFRVLQLTPFDYDVIWETVRKCLPACDESWIKQLSAHLLNFTGGHPGCIAQALELYTKKNYPPPNRFFTESGKEIWKEIVYPTAKSVRSDISPRLRGILDKLSTFRYLDYSVLGQFVTGDEPAIRGYEDESELADKLTNTYLFSRKVRLLRDDITRRLLVMRLKKRESHKKWSERCRIAQAICAERLRELATQMPEFWAIEYLFQSLQQHAKDIDDLAKERVGICHTFFEEHVPEALQLLLDSGRSLRIKEEKQALKEALAAKENWEFRFTVNYYLREDQYSDEPFVELQRRIDAYFFSALKGGKEND